MDEYELAKMRQILEANKDKTFVDRILNKDKYPRLEEADTFSRRYKAVWGE